jgi:hypothetical protein
VKCSAAARENRGSARRAAYDAAVRGLLVLLMFAACYTPSIATGVACAPNGACPDGQTCAGTVCVLTGAPADAGTDADASSAGDRDGDSVMNANDNCPDVANTDQGDEDSDQIGDRCDLCPQLPGGSTADADGDAIGDACDPNPGVRDATWLFEGFHGSLPVWPGSNLWRSSTDSIRVAAAGEPAPDSEYLVLPLNAEGRTYDNYSTAITITVEQVAAGSEKGLGVEYFDGTEDVGMWCELGELNGGRVLWLADDLDLDQRVAYAWTTGATYILQLVRRGSTYRCDVGGPQGATTVSGTSPVVPRTGASTDIWAYGVTAQFLSVSVVGPAP